MKNSQFTVGDIMAKFGHIVIKQGGLSDEQFSAIHLLSVCKTAALGGHWEKCNHCNHIKKHYNSCGNRNCPNCQGVNKQKWILDRNYDLLPVKYFHCVFTVPAQLRALFWFNNRLLYNLLHQSAKETLLEFGWDKRQKMEAKIGGISILHTWTQLMEYHPHFHFIIPAGGINKKGQWKSSKGKDDFLFHVKALSAKFKQKFLALLHQLYIEQKLVLPPNLKVASNYYRLKNKLYQIDWVVYSKEAFDGPKQVLEYLARYTHKICISNYRILNVTDQHVTFFFLNRKKKKKQTKTLTGVQFVKRFIQHVLPRGFTKIRHFGFLSCRSKKKDLAIIRKQLKLPPMMPKINFSTREIMIRTTGIDPYVCPYCKKGEMVVFKRIYPIRGSPVKPNLRIFAHDKNVCLS